MFNSGSPPVELLAEEQCILYWRVRELREEGELTVRGLRALRSQARTRLLGKWSDILFDPRVSGIQTAEAVRPCLPEVGQSVCPGSGYKSAGLPVVLRERTTRDDTLTGVGARVTTKPLILRIAEKLNMRTMSLPLYPLL
ncbi:hypothetical protein EAI_08543 [Harpegnathos saltator]|uniref:Uncharacterized protein n=1 Tax=Harpegnathos saltator TaxID=610380 RepID=E2BCQ3_HARSA|nr:hypothetical protein EAI_08543 [Harpegnathos saltator]